MASGIGQQNVEISEIPNPANKEAFQVAAFISLAQPIQRVIRLDGQTKPNRQLLLKSEASGKISALAVSKGDLVSAGSVLLKLDPGELPSRIKSARATKKQLQIEYETSQALFKKNYLSETLLAEAEAAYISAVAQLESLQSQFNKTIIKAPFGGTLEELDVEIGSFINRGETIGRLLDYHPVLVTGSLPEAEIANVSVGDRAQALLSNGESWNGRIRYISSRSDPITKTFDFEIEVISSAYDLLTGLTATINIPQPIVLAHYLSPALLQLNDQGKMGVKTVDVENYVKFKPVKMIKSGNHGIWLTGLRAEETVILRGQGFVHHGEQVRIELLENPSLLPRQKLNEFSVGFNVESKNR